MNTMQIVDFSNAVTNRRLALMLAVDFCKDKTTHCNSATTMMVTSVADDYFNYLEGNQ